MFRRPCCSRRRSMFRRSCCSRRRCVFRRSRCGGRRLWCRMFWRSRRGWRRCNTLWRSSSSGRRRGGRGGGRRRLRRGWRRSSSRRFRRRRGRRLRWCCGRLLRLRGGLGQFNTPLGEPALWLRRIAVGYPGLGSLQRDDGGQNRAGQEQTMNLVHSDCPMGILLTRSSEQGWCSMGPL